MSSFDRLLEIGFQGRTQEEIAQVFLWYHLRRHPTKKTAGIKRIQKYFKKADKPTPSDRLIRNAFFNNNTILPGSRDDTYSLEPNIKPWFDENYGSCFEPQSLKEKLFSFVERIFNPKLAVWIGRITFIIFVMAAIITIIMFINSTPG